MMFTINIINTRGVIIWHHFFDIITIQKYAIKHELKDYLSG